MKKLLTLSALCALFALSAQTHCADPAPTSSFDEECAELAGYDLCTSFASIAITDGASHQRDGATSHLSKNFSPKRSADEANAEDSDDDNKQGSRRKRRKSHEETDEKLENPDPTLVFRSTSISNENKCRMAEKAFSTELQKALVAQVSAPEAMTQEEKIYARMREQARRALIQRDNSEESSELATLALLSNTTHNSDDDDLS